MTLNKTDRIVITLGKQIVHGKYVPGSPLPAEAELCEEFATSRNIIREVFRSLMAKRLIEMKRYRGAFVAPRNQWNYLDTDVLQWVLENDYDPRLISAMSEVRNLVEPAIARWAAERATSSDLAQIESALNEMIANNQDREAFTALDAGAQALKIFPSSAFGPQYIKALKAVLPPNIAVFAVGGVTPENLAQWIDAGCAGAGLGSDLYRAGQSVERTAQQAAAFVKAYREAVQ
ncbi:TPA: GntR family transcriptional regulator [Escherichia coli]